MRKLIRRILIKLGLVKPKKIGWKWYGRVSGDWIVRGEIVDPIDEWVEITDE